MKQQGRPSLGVGYVSSGSPEVSRIDRLRLTVEPGIHLESGDAFAIGIQFCAFITLDRPWSHGSRKREHKSERLEKHSAN